MTSVEFSRHLETYHKDHRSAIEVQDMMFEAGYIISASHSVMVGESNEVHECEAREANYILRISKSGKNVFPAEKWSTDRVRDIAVPAPFITLDTVDGVPICVYQKAEGEIFDIWSSDHEQVQQYAIIARQAGEMLRRIHSVEVDGFGPLDSQGHAEHDNIIDVLEEEFESLAQYDPEVSSACISRLYQDGKYLATGSARLIHGDFGPKHIITDNSQIVSIIDWGNVLGGPPVLDFGRWEYYYAGRLPYTSLLSGYAPDSYQLEQLQGGMVLAQAYWGARSCRHYHELKADSQIQSATDRLHGLLS